MKPILCFLFGAVVVFGLSYVPSLTLAQTDKSEEVTGHDLQGGLKPTEEELKVTPDAEEPPFKWEEALPYEDNGPGAEPPG